MKAPFLTGLIDRRILVNFRADPAVVGALLPGPFRPQLVNHQAIVGICLIRLKQVRPTGMPAFVGFASENAAHRIAVEWTNAAGALQQGVYIPRRDTSSQLNRIIGNQLIGTHFHATFSVAEKAGSYAIGFDSGDGTYLRLKANATNSWPDNSIFPTLEHASAFFQKGAAGYSPSMQGRTLNGIELKTSHWEVSPLSVEQVDSSFFADKRLFPAGSATFDNALLMQNIPHEWRRLPSIP